MTAWWYANKGKKAGPVDIDELKRLLQTGQIGSKTMLWREGMEAWKSLGKIDDLNGLKAAVPPPLPPETESDPRGFPLVNRWPRFFARIFDVWWEMLLVSFVLMVVLSWFYAGFLQWINIPGSTMLFAIFCLPIALFLDALLFVIAGNTPGKALLGLKVATVDNKPLAFASYLNRNFSMWLRGLALGFPLVPLFTMASQYRRLGKGQQTSYDEAWGFRVRAKPSGLIRKIVFGFAFASLLVGMIGMIGLRIKQQAVTRTPTGNYFDQFDAPASRGAYSGPILRGIFPPSYNWDEIAQQAGVKTWNQVLADPDFQKLSSVDKLAAKKQYFEDVIRPHVRQDSVYDAREKFFLYGLE